TEEVYNFITGPRDILNVTEWAKKEKCWNNAKEFEWTITEDFVNSLVPEVKENKNTVNEATVDSMVFVTEQEPEFWYHLIDWGKKYLYLNPLDEGVLKSAIKIRTEGKVPTDRQ